MHKQKKVYRPTSTSIGMRTVVQAHTAVVACSLVARPLMKPFELLATLLMASVTCAWKRRDLRSSTILANYRTSYLGEDRWKVVQKGGSRGRKSPG